MDKYLLFLALRNWQFKPDIPLQFKVFIVVGSTTATISRHKGGTRALDNAIEKIMHEVRKSRIAGLEIKIGDNWQQPLYINDLMRLEGKEWN